MEKDKTSTVHERENTKSAALLIKATVSDHRANTSGSQPKEKPLLVLLAPHQHTGTATHAKKGHC